MLITVRGRVEMDPMRVPLAASMATGRDESFEQVLQETVASEPTQRVDARHPEQERVDHVDAEPTPAADEAPADEPVVLPTGDATTTPETLMTPGQGPTANAVDVTDDIRRGEPVRQETAGKGADSPRTSSRQVEPLLVAAMQHGAPAADVPFVVAAGNRGVGAVGAARAVEAPARGIETPFARANAPLRTPATTTAYRTNDVASAQLLEQARDSVFKQILLQLTGEGGEMRMRLDPPELGELDLRLVVEGGNRLQLTVAAERQDVNDLLQRHLDELKQTLQQAGLEVTGASVQTRSEFAREQSRRDAARDEGALPGETQDLPPTNVQKHGGYVSATGLDFWA